MALKRDTTIRTVEIDTKIPNCFVAQVILPIKIENNLASYIDAKKYEEDCKSFKKVSIKMLYSDSVFHNVPICDQVLGKITYPSTSKPRTTFVICMRKFPDNLPIIVSTFNNESTQDSSYTELTYKNNSTTSSFDPTSSTIVLQARGAQENIFSFGKSSAKLFSKDTPRTTFLDVAGVDEAKQELTEIVDFLKNPGKYKAMGARTPKGVLMIGPSGTGKTLLARATAGEAGVAFFSMAGSEFMEMLVGVGASRVRDLFNNAKKAQPAIIFIDEIDAIGRQRGAGFMGGHDEREQTLNQILVEMDGFTPNEQLVVMAATNRPDVLDPALVRPGRFDRRVALELPDVKGREAILKIHARGKPFEKNVDWVKTAKRTVGFSGADLENMLNEAAILAARLGKKAIDMSDLEEAATKVKLGPEKKRLQSEEDRRMTAYHEAGHALVSWVMPNMDPIHRISIISRGMSLGHTMMEPIDRVHETKTHLIEEIAVMLGGRAAESLVFKEITTGASDDIAKATEVARRMVVAYGMSELGPVNLDGEDRRTPYESSNISPDMAAKIDAQVKQITDEGYRAAIEVLKKVRTKLDLLANELLVKETIESEEFEKLIGPKKLATVKAKA
jgi:cell division protease FtsH